MKHSSPDSCNICDNRKENNYIDVSEKMLQTYEVFRYLECGQCGCLSLLNNLEDMSRYYPSSYYSFTKNSVSHKKSTIEKLKYMLRISSMKGYLGKGSFLDSLITKIRPIHFLWLKKVSVSLDSKILDVGCGNGFLLSEMRQYGFHNLYGIDLFTQNNVKEDGLNISQSDIHRLEESEFDFMMYNHSFEHIENPHLELKIMYNKLSDNGTLMIRVPLCDSYAFRHYRENWVQLDAPRHYFLYTRASMQTLAKQHGFEIVDVLYDSNGFQFAGSECYVLNEPLSKIERLFSSEKLFLWEEKAKELNQIEDGDQICFYLKKRK